MLRHTLSDVGAGQYQGTALSSDTLVAVSLAPKDWTAVQAIYLEGIATGNSTFEKSAPEWDSWDRDHLLTYRLIARAGGEVVG